MIKVLYGKKGTGKTRTLVDAANSLAAGKSGDIVFIDSTNKLMHDLRRGIRLINASEFPVDHVPAFLGFICGIISGNYDIKAIFIDGLTYIIKQDVHLLQDFFGTLKEISKRFDIDFHISANGDPESMPEFMREFTE